MGVFYRKVIKALPTEISPSFRFGHQPPSDDVQFLGLHLGDGELAHPVLLVLTNYAMNSMSSVFKGEFESEMKFVIGYQRSNDFVGKGISYAPN